MPDDRPGDQFERFGRKIDDTFQNVKPKVELELQKLVKYINDEVVPDVRREGSQALRSAAEQMRKLAEYMESHSNASKNAGQ